MQVWRKCVALLCQEACDVDFCGDPSPPTVGEAPSELLCPIGRSDLLLAFHTNALGIGCRLAANRGGGQVLFRLVVPGRHSRQLSRGHGAQLGMAGPCRPLVEVADIVAIGKVAFRNLASFMAQRSRSRENWSCSGSAGLSGLARRCKTVRHKTPAS